MSAKTCSIEGCEGAHRARGWCTVHYFRWRRTGDPVGRQWIWNDDVARFWSKVDKDGPGGCWLWTGSIAHGYGQMNVRTAPNEPATVKAHRFAYEQLVGPIPAGLTLDHLCRVRNCVNPAHLEPVTNRVNVLRGTGPSAQHARKTHCPRGHPYDEANTYLTPSGTRACRECQRAASRRYEQRKRAERRETAACIPSPRKEFDVS